MVNSKRTCHVRRKRLSAFKVHQHLLVIVLNDVIELFTIQFFKSYRNFVKRVFLFEVKQDDAAILI